MAHHLRARSSPRAGFGLPAAARRRGAGRARRDRPRDDKTVGRAPRGERLAHAVSPGRFTRSGRKSRPRTRTFPAPRGGGRRRPAGRFRRRAGAGEGRPGFRWQAATEQTLLFLSIQHGYAFTQPKTRRDLSGPFFRDYFRSVASIGKWGDGGKFFTNYVAHPMQGALLGFVWVQNDPKGKAAPFGRSKAYWRSRAKALAWSAAWSTQFELGPVSQASVGNVGLHGKQTWVDIVVTPTVGTAWLVAEDALDRFIVRRIERRTDNRFVRIAARMLFSPTRSSANLLRFEKPWRRDR